MTSSSSRSSEARRALAQRILHRRRAVADPLYLASYMTAIDEGDGSQFTFEHIRWPLEPQVQMLSDRDMGPQADWRWQRLAGELMRDSKRFMALKGRQIGITWLWLALDCAEAILMPGSTSLVYRQREADAIDSVRRSWILYKSLPAWWTAHITVVSPDRGVEPGREGIKLMFPDGRISRITPMTSSMSSGHGRTLRRALADEAAHIEYLGSIKKAVEPAAEQLNAKIGYISTANGRSNQETGAGNRFHYDWVNSTDEITRLFFPYNVHPRRDEKWYERVPYGVLGLTEQEVNEQYPRNEHEAFALTSHTYIPSDVLKSYQKLCPAPVRRVMVEKRSSRSAAIVDRKDGSWLIFREPEEDHSYAIGVDTATTRGLDFSAATVIDLTDMAICAQHKRKIDPDLFAHDLHYIGKRYGTALIAVESAGGYGDAVIIPLRDGREGRPAYPKLYRHVLSSRPDLPVSKPFGYPISSKTRPQLNYLLAKALREHALPWVTDDLLAELENLVNWETGPSPRAAEGHHDDLVFSTAIAVEMYRQKGHHADRYKPKQQKRYRNWLSLT